LRFFQPVSLKMKEKLNRFSRATRRFICNKVLRRQQPTQRCEILLDGFDDRIERLILMVSAAGVGSSESVHLSLPSFFESRRLAVPRAMLPEKSGERLTVYVYGVTSQIEGGFQGYSRVLVSGVCSLQSGE
jgi:hypothetical protein